jgi:hypothetical protein
MLDRRLVPSERVWVSISKIFITSWVIVDICLTSRDGGGKSDILKKLNSGDPRRLMFPAQNAAGEIQSAMLRP